MWLAPWRKEDPNQHKEGEDYFEDEKEAIAAQESDDLDTGGQSRSATGVSQ